MTCDFHQFSFLFFEGFFIPFIFLAELVKSFNITDNKTSVSVVYSIIGLSNAVGRVFAGWVADRPWANTVILNNASLVLAGILTIAFPFCTNLAYLSLVSVGFGISTGKLS